MKRGEAAIFVLIAAVIVGLGLGDEYFPRKSTIEAGETKSSFLSTVWYCPEVPDEGFTNFIVTSNLGAEPVHLRRWAAANSSASAFVESDLAPNRRGVVSAGDFGIPAAVAAVETFGAATLTDLEVLAPGAGVASSSCSVQPQDRWMFPVASTSRDRDTHLVVANPFEEEARVGVRIISAEEDVSPARLQEFTIPRLSQVPIFLGDFYKETDLFGVVVTAGRGRVLVLRVMRVQSRDGTRGLIASLGAQTASESWLFAGGEVPLEGDESLILMNPGDRESLVQVSLPTETEEVVQPFRELVVPAAGEVAVKLPEHLPRGVRHSAVVTSLNDVPLVVERFTYGNIGGIKGVDSILGQNAVSRRWAVSVRAIPGASTILEILNRGATRSSVSVTLLGEQADTSPPELAAIPLEANRRATVDISAFLPAGGAVALVSSGSEIVVERRLLVGDPYRDFDSIGGHRLR